MTVAGKLGLLKNPTAFWQQYGPRPYSSLL